MRSTAIRKPLAALLASLICSTGATAASSGVIVHEPLLGLRWTSTAVRFAPADPGLKLKCDNLVNDNYDSDYWVLARAASPRGELMVISGRMIPRRPELPDEPGDLGVFLRLTGDGCLMIGPAAAPFNDAEGYSPDVSAKELRSLAADAVTRYVAAYGSAAKLCAAARRQGKRLASLPLGLRAAFAARARCLR